MNERLCKYNQAMAQRPGQRFVSEIASLHKIRIGNMNLQGKRVGVNSDTKSIIHTLIDPTTAFLSSDSGYPLAADAVVAARAPLTLVLDLPHWTVASADNLPAMSFLSAISLSSHVTFQMKIGCLHSREAWFA